MSDVPCQNTDREIWRERPDDYYCSSIHVTQDNYIGINCGGNVQVMSVRAWHAMPSLIESLRAQLATAQAEVDALKHDIERHQNISTELLTDRDALLALVREAEPVIDYIEPAVWSYAHMGKPPCSKQDWLSRAEPYREGK